ncbi:MAG: phosphotransferase, partial [bacterium]|nr:phosphotransferase [bacterium]
MPDPDLVARLVGTQAPALAGLTIAPSGAKGSSNWVYRLGDGLAVRMPRSPAYSRDLLKEVDWLPRLRPSISTPIPEVVVAGEPSAEFSLPWAIVSWL